MGAGHDQIIKTESGESSRRCLPPGLTASFCLRLMASQEKSSGKTLASSPRTSRLCSKEKEGVLWNLAKLDSDVGPKTVAGAALPGLRNGNSIIFEVVSSIRINVGHVCQLNINDKHECNNCCFALLSIT